MFKTQKTLVLKTAMVTGVKLATPADRIGLGFGIDAYPTDNLSLGQFPTPHNPEPEQVRSRQSLSAVQQQVREHMRLQSGHDVVPPAGSTGLVVPRTTEPTGCLGSPGSTVIRSSSSALTLTGWRSATRTAASGSNRVVRRLAVPDRADLPGDLRHDDRLGRDCQSLRRPSGKRVASREVRSVAEAGK